MARDLLGVDRVLLDPGPGVGLVVARPLERRSASRTSTSSRSRARGSRAIGPSASSARGLLLDLEGGRVAQVGQRLGRLLADEARRAGHAAGRSRRRAPARRRAAPRRRRGPSGRAPRAAGRRVGLALLELLLHLGAAAQPAVDLDVAQLRLASGRPAAATSRRTRGSTRSPATRRRGAAGTCRGRGSPSDVEHEADAPRPTMPDDDERRATARERPPRRLRRDLEADLDLARRAPPSARGSACPASAAARRPAGGPAAGSATGGVAWSSASSSRTFDRGAVALEPLLGGVALRDQPLGLAGLLEHRAPLDEGRRRPRRGARARRDSVSRSRSSWARAISPCSELAARVGRRASSATLSRPGFLAPSRLQLVDRPLELLPGAGRAAVGAADRRLEAVAERGLVAVEVGQLVVADRRGRAEERLGRDAGQLGEGLVGERRIGDRPRRRARAWTVPLGPRNAFSTRARRGRRRRRPRTSNSIAMTGRASAPASHGTSPSRSPAARSPCASGRARARAGSSSCRPRWGRGRPSGPGASATSSSR